MVKHLPANAGDVDSIPDLGGVFVCVCVCVCVRAGKGRGATITDRYVHQSVECQYKSQFLVAEGKCMTWY